MSGLRLVVFTAGPLTAVDRVFYERLARDPLLDLRAVVVEGRAAPRRPLLWRIARGVRREGWGWLWFKAVTRGGDLVRNAMVAVFERWHRPLREESYRTLAHDTGVAVHHVPDIEGEESRSLIRTLQPQLAVVVGNDLRGDLLGPMLPLGALSLERRQVLHERRGSTGETGEVLAGESAVSVILHAAGDSSSAGVMADAPIPIEECDTLESLRIKGDLVGARLYHDAIRAVARGEQPRAPRDSRRTPPAPSEYRLSRLRRRLRRRAARRMPVMQARATRAGRARVFLQYVLVAPFLFWLRRRLQMQRRAPVCILFYHLVANRPLNHMCLPLEEFARQMEFLRRYYPLLSLGQAVARLGRQDSDEVAVAITFDDGYRDNTWAVEYLRYFGMPACFFVSIGHVLDGSAFEHDRRRGFSVLPLGEDDLRRLAADGFEVGSHGLYHEDFGALDAETAERVLSESRRLIGRVTGFPPEHFSFPKGHRGTNITAESFAAAVRHYRHVYSAYGGYNIPGRQRREYLLRLGNPTDVIEMAMILDGYTGLRQCLVGNAWGLKISRLAPYISGNETRVRAARPGPLLPGSGR